MGENKIPLERKEVGNKAIYKNERVAAPGVFRSVIARTIVPSGGDIDTALRQGNVNRYMAMLKTPKEEVNQ